MFDRLSGARFLALVVVAALAGCATPPPRDRPPERPDAPQAIAVVVDPSPPRLGGEDSKVPEGAMRGAGAGALAGLVVALQAGVALIVFPPLAGAIIGAGALGGAMWGAAQGAADDHAIAAQRAQGDITASVVAPASTASGVVDAGAGTGAIRIAVLADARVDPDDASSLRALHAQGYGALIHLRGPQVRYASRPGPGYPSRITLLVEGRMVDTASGRLVALRDFVIESEAAPIDEWTANYGALARERAEQANRALAERVIEAFVLHAPDALGPGALGAAACGVHPRDPPPQHGGLVGPWAAAVHSLRPALSWDPVPARDDYQALPADARDLRYDLRVWRLDDGVPVELVVERAGLEAPTYQIEQDLRPGTEYGWSVRLRYFSGGQPRGLRWSASQAPLYTAWGVRPVQLHTGIDSGGYVQARACRDEDMTPCRCLDFIPAANLWRFRTP
jgi:hypothetical protein